LDKIHASLGGRECGARRFLLKNPEHVKMYAPPNGYEQPVKQFLEIFQKNTKNATV